MLLSGDCGGTRPWCSSGAAGQNRVLPKARSPQVSDGALRCKPYSLPVRAPNPHKFCEVILKLEFGRRGCPQQHRRSASSDSDEEANTALSGQHLEKVPDWGRPIRCTASCSGMTSLPTSALSAMERGGAATIPTWAFGLTHDSRPQRTGRRRDPNNPGMAGENRAPEAPRKGNSGSATELVDFFHLVSRGNRTQR